MKEYWVVTGNFFPLWAGPSERFFRYSKLSEQYGLKLSFKTFYRGQGKPVETIGRTDVYRYQTKDFKELTNIVASEVEKGYKPDAVVFLGLDKSIITTSKRLRKNGVKSIYVSTMDFDLDFRDNGKKRDLLRRYLFVRLFRKMINSFDSVVSSSGFLSMRYHEKLGIALNKLEVIPNGVNSRIFKPELNLINDYREELGIPKNQVVFLFVGLLIERKGIISLLKAWQEYKQSNGEGWLILVGDEKRYNGDQDFFESYSLLRSQLEGSSSEVKFFGPSNEVHKFFKASDAFLFLSYLEGMPNVLMEAMACRLPIVLNKFKGYSDDYGTDGEHFISVDVHNQSQIVSTIKELANNPEKRIDIGKAAESRIRDNFLIEDSIRKYTKIIKN